MTNLPVTPLGGRIGRFVRQWEKLTNDQNILDIVRGWTIPLASPPGSRANLKPYAMSSEEHARVSEEVASMLGKGAICLVNPSPSQFLSNIFLRVKKDGTDRPIINLKDLNSHIKYEKFKMESLKNLKDLLHPGDLMVKIDLKDAYFSIPLNERSRKLVRFEWEGKLYEFVCLMFGLGPAPRIFTKLLKIPMGFLRKLKIRLIIYIDDILVMANGLEGIIMARDSVLAVLQSLGFVINRKKSVLDPSTLMEFLGFVVDSFAMTLSVPQEKAVNLGELCKTTLLADNLSLWELSRVVGKLRATAPALTHAPLQIRYLQQILIKAVSQGRPYSFQVSLDQKAKLELKWWLENLSLLNGKPLNLDLPDMIISSDGAKTGGWGAACEHQGTGGSLVGAGGNLPHQRTGTSCSETCDLNFHKDQKTKKAAPLGRQHIRVELPSENGGHPQSHNAEFGQGDLGVPNAEGDHSYCRVHPLRAKRDSGLVVQKLERHQRVEVKPNILPRDLQSLWDTGHRLVRIEDITPGPKILQLEARPRELGSECPPPVLDPPKAICFPSILPNRTLPEKSKGGQSPSDPGDSFVDFTTVVPNHTGDGSSSSNTATDNSRPFKGTKRGSTSSLDEQVPPVSSLEGLVGPEGTNGISGTAASLITRARTAGTRDRYKSSWARYASWCGERQVDPVTSDLKLVLSFLGHLFDEGLEYSTINSYRSALSLYHQPIEGMKVGQHPMVSALMTGVSNERPQVPKHIYVWDAEVVLKYMRNLGENDTLDSLKLLSWKVATLLGMCNVHRSQELGALDEKFMAKSDNKYTCGFGVSVKHRRKGKPSPPVVFYRFEGDTKLCPVDALDEYLKRTKVVRSEANTTQLFLSVVKPHHPVTRSTIAKWVVNFLKLAGIDTDKFKGHSIRSASSSKVRSSGVSVEEVLKMGNWSSAEVWHKFYNKPIETPLQRCQKALLESAL